ncbi:hypothetical protein RIF29_10554 [Crotalaria pallida]|uniref:Uncharacterized protein n=1 Tax=Crotalaria pallida TaxID=3830 RepID=A0AAN9IJX5_CROPI
MGEPEVNWGGRIGKNNQQTKSKAHEKSPKFCRVFNNKKQRVNEVIEISSSYHDAMKEELSELKSTMKCIKETVENMAKIIVSNNSNLTFMSSPNGVPIMVSNSSTPMPAPMPETKTKSFKNKQASPTMNARAFEQSSNGTPETQMRKRLFNPHKNAKSCDFYLNPRHLGIPKFDVKRGGGGGRYLKVLTPSNMVLDDFEAAILAYAFRCDYDNFEMDEVLVHSSWGLGNRSMINTLMPMDRVHQEAAVMNWKTTPKALIENYQAQFMGKVEFVRKVDSEIRLRVAIYLIPQDTTT